MLPYHLECTEQGTGLYQLKDGRFQLIQQGPIARLMCGPGYVLMENDLAEYLEWLALPRVTFRDAVIWDRKQNKEYTSHKQLQIGQYFVANQIHDLNLDDERLLIMDDEYLFASPSLKTKLEGTRFSYLKFSEGLSNFAGRET